VVIDVAYNDKPAGFATTAGGTRGAILLHELGHVMGLMHVKDIKASTVPNNGFRMDPANVGSGALDWKSILSAGYGAGVRYYYVEQEPPFTGPRMDAARTDYEYLVGVA